jgi:periplasmic protein TonB
MEVKKTRNANVHRKSGLYFGVGLIFSITLVITAFEWRFYDDAGMMDLGVAAEDIEELIDIPITEQPPPPLPVIHQPEIIEVPDDEEIIEEIDINLDVEINEDTEIEEFVFKEAPKEEEVDRIFTIVEENASFPGGSKAYAKFLRKNLKYPNQARRMGIEGRVYVQFIIRKDGAITEVTAIKGIGGGCDEEAVRVIRNSPNWSPGKQRGRAVIQKMIIPISFKLN